MRGLLPPPITLRDHGFFQWRRPANPRLSRPARRNFGLRGGRLLKQRPMTTRLATVFPLARHPSFTDLDAAELRGLGLVWIRLKNDEIRLLALFE